MTDNSLDSRDQPTADATAEPAAWITMPEVSERLGLVITRVHQLIRDGNLIAFRRDGVLRVPADLIGVDADGKPAVVKHLSGVLTLLRDTGYSDEEILQLALHPGRLAARVRRRRRCGRTAAPR